MTDLRDIRYVRIGSEDLDASIAFAVNILGLELTEREANCAYLRGDDRDHNICYTRGASSGQVTGWELATMAELDAAAAAFEQAGISVRAGTASECDQRRVRGLVIIADPSGNVIELVARPAASGRRYFPSRDAGITHFSHVGLHTRDAPKDEAFWIAHLGAKVSDWIGAAC